MQLGTHTVHTDHISSFKILKDAEFSRQQVITYAYGIVVTILPGTILPRVGTILPRVGIITLYVFGTIALLTLARKSSSVFHSYLVRMW